MLKQIGMCVLYTTVIILLLVVCYFLDLLITSILIVPLLAELLLAKSNWSRIAITPGILLRGICIVAANALYYFVFTDMILYGSEKPWPEDQLWAVVIALGQTFVAIPCFLFMHRLSATRTTNDIEEKPTLPTP